MTRNYCLYVRFFFLLVAGIQNKLHLVLNVYKTDHTKETATKLRKYLPSTVEVKTYSSDVQKQKFKKASGISELSLSHHFGS